MFPSSPPLSVSLPAKPLWPFSHLFPPPSLFSRSMLAIPQRDFSRPFRQLGFFPARPAEISLYLLTPIFRFPNMRELGSPDLPHASRSSRRRHYTLLPLRNPEVPPLGPLRLMIPPPPSFVPPGPISSLLYHTLLVISPSLLHVPPELFVVFFFFNHVHSSPLSAVTTFSRLKAPIDVPDFLPFHPVFLPSIFSGFSALARFFFPPHLSLPLV